MSLVFKDKELRRKFKVAAIASSLMVVPLTLSAQMIENNARAGTNPSETTQPASTAIPPEPKQPHIFVPISSFVPLFSTAEEKTRNIFFATSPEAVREFRTLTNNQSETGPLTLAENKLLHNIRLAAAPDVKKYKIPAAVAATLRFAAQQTGLDYDTMMTRLQENSGNVANARSAQLQAGDVYKFSIPTWLYLMKTYGPRHGMSFFADKIDLTTASVNADGQQRATLDVQDPAMLRQIAAMRGNPRISTLLGAEYIKNEASIPQAAYKGMNYAADPHVAEQQRALMTIGFDLGIRGADGVKGPLTAAALKEFALMSQPLLAQGQTLDGMLVQSAQQAVQDAQQYSTVYNKISPASAFAIRHASKVAGADFGYMMQLAGAESNFDITIGAKTSSAKGLFQFIDNSWLITLYQYGAKYGLGDITAKIEVTRNEGGEILTGKIADPLVEKYVLGLRNDPRISALMGAEFAKANRAGLQAALPSRDITRTDQYLAHFLGPGKAVSFISRLEHKPHAPASAAFPAAAESNHGVFYKKGHIARSMSEVYDFFRAKFSLSVFDTPQPTRSPTASVPLPPPRPSGM